MAILEEPIKEVAVLPNYIDGEWVESEGEMYDVMNPATQQVIAQGRFSTAGEMNNAVAAAKDAFEDWSNIPPVSRIRYLFRLKELVEENFEYLSRVQTMEHGKTIDESRGETRRGIENIEVATGIPTLMMGSSLENIARGIDERIMRQPLGVFGVISPFNFPFMVALWFAPYAVATGNCVIIKQSPRDPISQFKIAELVEEAGFPPGVWNVVNGGEEAATALIDHPDVQGISFVGSTPVGKEIYRKCGETGKRVIAQCGAKNFSVLMPDADIDNSVAALMTSFFGNTGQRCLATANLIIVGDDAYYRTAMERVVAATKRIRVGYGLNESIQMGPIQSVPDKERVFRYIEQGIAEGATLTLDGRIPDIIGEYPDTCFLNPTIFEDVTPDMSIGKEEIFGPVMSVMRAGTLDEAIDMIHGNPFGNSASIFTNSGKLAREFRERVRVGNVGTNIGIVAPMAFFPFSGMKDSFFGILHGQGQEAVRFFTESKVAIERWF